MRMLRLCVFVAGLALAVFGCSQPAQVTRENGDHVVPQNSGDPFDGLFVAIDLDRFIGLVPGRLNNEDYYAVVQIIYNIDNRTGKEANIVHDIASMPMMRKWGQKINFTDGIVIVPPQLLTSQQFDKYKELAGVAGNSAFFRQEGRYQK